MLILGVDHLKKVKKNKNKMKKFDSAKWITENKYGKIFEQEKDE